jgi:hypothetical protein
MKRILKILFKTAIVLFLLPLFVVFGLFIYVQYINPDVEDKIREVSEIMGKSARPGNGFGGEEGFRVLDSKLRSSKIFFWLDNENVLFRTDFRANNGEDIQRNYVWNTQKDTIKPLSINDPLSCFSKNNLYYANPSETKTLPNGVIKAQVYQSKLRENDDRWVAESSQKIESIWTLPSEGYDLYWSDGCRPQFLEKSGFRSQNRNSSYRIKYFSEWGWILRLPRVAPTASTTAMPGVGVFSLGEEAYFGQRGQKITELSPSTASDLTNLHLVYVGFLDKYLLANKLYGDPAKRKILELVDRKGSFRRINALDDWPAYTGIPQPTRKGFFWSGTDYRVEVPAAGDVGVFLKDGKGRVHKVARGSAFQSALSVDGCGVAFFNPPDPGKDKGTLKVLDVCNSEVDGEVLQDVDY